ncbi:MAG: hypothetical protein IJY79_01350 [Clostridia bacterium]|nr:hypothetical protein [Clostridia bacterium]
MRKGIIVNLKRFKVLDYVTLNKIFIVLCVVFISGIAIGSIVLSKNNWLSQTTESLFKSYISVHSGNAFFKKLLVCFSRYLIVLVLYFLSGSSMLGVAVTPFITVWQGILFGSLSAHLYSSHGLSGIAFNAIILIPPSVIFTVCCFFAARYAIDFSLLIAKLTLPRSKPASLYINFKNYCGKYLIFIAVSLICAIIDIVLNLLFLKFFNF